MIVCYLRSSSIGTLSFCEQKYFLSYVLGFKDKTNKKAVMGSIMHKALEILGLSKIAQTNNESKVNIDDIGILSVNQCNDIDLITTKAFEFYQRNTPELNFTNEDLNTCIKWVYKAIQYNEGSMDPRNQNIKEVEVFFDIEIQKDWAWYEYKIGNQEINGFLSLKGTVDVLVDEGDIYHIQDYKGLPITTIIPTINGHKTIDQLSVGDIIFDRFGKQTKVIGKSIPSVKPCYKITFDDTSTVICDDEHKWKLHNGKTVSVNNLKIKDVISVAGICEYNQQVLPIDPYVLGLWLGDGRNRSGEITKSDSFIFKEITRRGYKLGINQKKRNKKIITKTVLELTNQLRLLNLLHNKHIPNIYLYSSYEQRLDLLRGLMDSDGSVNTTRKQCVFMNCNYRLSKDVKTLLLSLGQRPLLSKVKQKGFGLIVDAYPVSFKPVNINPFLLPRKHNKVKKNWGQGKSYIRQIRKIEKIEPQLTQCIAVDSDDHTFLCTENFIPTHNSGKRLNWSTDKEKNYECLQKDDQLLLYYYALKNMYPDKEFHISIFYVNDGGVYTFPFDKTDYEKAERMIRQKFEYIKDTKYPKLLSNDNSHWKCQYLCAFSKPFDYTGISICHHIRDEIKTKGIDKVTREYADFDKIAKYGDGGGRLQK